MTTNRGPVPNEPGKLALRERLIRLDAWSRIKAVPVEHNNEAFYAADASGRRWVGKRTEITGKHQFLSEAISTQLAWLLKLPVPEAAYAVEADELVWFSRLVPNVAHYNPARLPLTNHHVDFGRVLALDVWVHNEDRHAGNILLEGSSGLFKPWFIDFGTALVGFPQDYARQIDQVPREGQFAPRTVASELLVDGVDAALKSIGRLSELDIRGVVNDSCEIVGIHGHLPSLADLVLKRRESLSGLAHQFLVRLGVRP